MVSDSVTDDLRFLYTSHVVASPQLLLCLGVSSSINAILSFRVWVTLKHDEQMGQIGQLQTVNDAEADGMHDQFESVRIATG